MTVSSLILLTYFIVVSGIVYDVIVEPPTSAPLRTDLLERSDLSSSSQVVYYRGAIFWVHVCSDGVGIVLLDMALDKNHAKSVKVSYASAGVAFVGILYVMSMLFVRITIPGYLH